MCYGKDFTALIDARRGDLVYGLEKPKAKKYLSLLSLEEQLTVTMNTYNDFLLSLLRGYYLYDEVDSIKAMESYFIEVEKVMKKADQALQEAFDQHLKFHGEGFLGDEAYNIDKALEDISKGHKLKSRANTGETDFFLPIKRGCKLGLKDIVIKGFTVNGKRPILHFALDGINIKEVINKGEKYGYGITSSELRYLYRNKERIINKVIFYEEGKSVKCPWGVDEKSWSRYQPKSACL